MFVPILNQPLDDFNSFPSRNTCLFPVDQKRNDMFFVKSPVIRIYNTVIRICNSVIRICNSVIRMCNSVESCQFLEPDPCPLFSGCVPLNQLIAHSFVLSEVRDHLYSFCIL